MRCRSGWFRTLAVAALMIATAAPADAQRGRDGESRVTAERRGRIGISFSEADAGRVRVDAVLPGTPAAEAGLRTGDLIVRWNGREEVAAAVAGARVEPGDTIRIRVLARDGAERDVEIVAEPWAGPLVERIPGVPREVIVVRPGEGLHTLEVMRDSLLVHTDSLTSRIRILLEDSIGPRLRELEEMRVFDVDSILAAAGSFTLADELSFGRRGVAGAELTDLSAGLATYFEADEGVLVLRVSPGTPAARAGLRDGDVIIRAGGQAVRTVPDLRGVIAAGGDGDVEIEVVRRGNRHLLMIPRGVR